MASVVFLRAVNVGGHKTFRPSLLAGKLAHLGAISVGAAGTFIVPRSASEREIRAAFSRSLPFEAELMICRGSDLLELAESEPFPASGDLRRLVSAISERPRKIPDLPLCHPVGDRWEVKVIGVSGIFALILYRRLGNRSLDPTKVVERGLGVRATTRNWNTILKIRDLLGQERAAGGARAPGRGDRKP